MDKGCNIETKYLKDSTNCFDDEIAFSICQTVFRGFFFQTALLVSIKPLTFYVEFNKANTLRIVILVRAGNCCDSDSHMRS